MNNYCKRCRLRDGCLRKCKLAEVYEQGYNDAVEELKNAKKIIMEKETKTVEVQVYLKSIWRKPSEKPSNKGYGDNVIPIMFIDNQNNVYNFQFVSDDMDWDAVAINKDIIFWAYVTDILPNIPNLKDYKSIKTYEDACTALGEKVDEVALTNAGVPKHIIAIMKLELVCKALWGGEVKVYPDPNGNRTYYYPWFALYTKDEVERMDSEERGLLLSANAGAGAGAGWGYAFTNNRSSVSNADCGFRLCLDTYEKARYFGTQFLELWAEYLAYNFKVGERLK